MHSEQPVGLSNPEPVAPQPHPPQTATPAHPQTAHQGPAVLGIALLGMAEDLGLHMASRALEHVLQFCQPPVRRAVPLAMAMLYPSHPDLHAMDTLSRLSHDADQEVWEAGLHKRVD